VAYIDSHRDQFGVEPILHALEVAPSTYYCATSRPPSARALSDAALKPKILKVWKDNFEVYGVRKVTKQLRRDGVVVGRDQVGRLMAELGIKGMVRGKSVRTTKADPTAVRAPDLVKRDFTATEPNRLWVSDFTYVATWSGTVYVAFIVDVFSRFIVGWKASSTMRTELVLDALEMAIWARGTLAEGLVAHSDAGSQYTAIRYTERLADIDAAPSIGTVGDSYDNALAETVNGLYKNELIHRQGPWRNRDDVEVATAAWVHWWNNARLHGACGDVPPAEFEAAWREAQQRDAA
jgi:putative transposase